MAEQALDLDSYWMPFTGNREFKRNPRLITGAEGWHYQSADGRKVLDGLSGLWCCGAGHGRGEIADAIARQARTLDYSPAFQFGHESAFRLFGDTLATDHLRHTLLPENRFVRGLPDHGAHLADELEELIALHDASTIAAVIVEPIAGSAGVLPPPKGYLQRLREITRAHDILLIFDEVITGLGRCGATTAAECFDVVPDIAAFAKQLTNGVVPMGAVMVRGDIYDVFMEQGGPDYMVEFPHGYTYSGHPIACAAAHAALDLLEREDHVGAVRERAGLFEDCIHALANHPHVTDVRNFGLAGALTLASYPGEPARRPYEIAQWCWQRGLYVRYGGDTLQFAPAFRMDSNDIAEIFNIVGDALKAA